MCSERHGCFVFCSTAWHWQYCCTTRAYVADCGTASFSGNATVITSPPSPPWAPNDANSSWIGLSANGNNPHGGTGDNATRYLYHFETELLGQGTITGAIGWDNRLIGYQWLNASGVATGGVYAASSSWITPFNDPSESGFCRDADGVFDGSAYPNCLAQFTISVNQRDAAGIRFILEGDGQTDGFRVAGATSVVPEPSTYMLMAAGLAGLGFFARRRKA